MYSKKTEDSNLNVFNPLPAIVPIMEKQQNIGLKWVNTITEINESETLTKHISCECKCKFDGKKCNSYQKWNNDKCWCKCKNPAKHHICEKDCILNPATCICKNSKYLASIIDT